MKRIALALLTALCLALTGCMPITSELQAVEGNAQLPQATAAKTDPVTGDTLSSRQVDAVVMFPSTDQQDLIGVERTLTVEGYQTLAFCLVQALLQGPDSADARRAAPEGVKVESVRVSDDVAVVDLSIDARSAGTPRQAYILRSAIVNTLSGIEGIRWVDVLVAGRVESSLALPTGAGEATTASLSAQWTQAQAEDELSEDETTRTQRQALLYYPDKSGRFVIPVAQSVTIIGSDSLWALISTMMLGGSPDPSLNPILPDASGGRISSAQLTTLPDGRNVARLYFEGNFNAELERANLNLWQVCAALTCTLTGFLPGLDGIQVYVGAGQLVRLDGPEATVTLEDGVMTRDMFERMIGSLRSVYMTATDGHLRKLGRAMGQRDALSPRRLLEPLFNGPESWETEVLRCVPDGLSIDDLIGVRVENGEATLNFSASFYAGCQRLTPQQERNLIYALVNTLTEDGSIHSVRIQIEGETVEKLVHAISLLGPLVRNPGLNAR